MSFVIIWLFIFLQVQEAVQALIDQHQKIPGNILRALLERFHRRPKEA